MNTIRGFATDVAKKILDAFDDAKGNPETFFRALDYVELAEGGFQMTAPRYVRPAEHMQHLVRQASLGQMQPIKIGSITLGGGTDVTDPCYDRGHGNDLHVSTVPGIYDVFLQYSDESFGDEKDEWDFRVNRIRIVNREWAQQFNTKYGPQLRKINLIDAVPVDAGLCGFFNQKPNFDDKGWDRFCADLGNRSQWKFCNYDGLEGVCCSSGFGDGFYSVYGLKENGSERNCILEIRFIEEDE